MAMEEQGVVPDSITYNALISACEKGEQFEKALAVFSALERQGVVPDAMTCNALLSACEKGSQPE